MSLCTECGEDSIAIETRMDHRGWRRRRRVCKVCAHRFTTYEIPADSLTVDDTTEDTDETHPET